MQERETLEQVLERVSPDEVCRRAIAFWGLLVDEEHALPWWAWRRRRRARELSNAAARLVAKIPQPDA